MGKNIILKKLEITNYRSIKHQVLTFEGNSKIVGENRIGKTNTLDALYWLLTDKLLNGSKDIEQIKPLEDTKLKVRVDGTFLVDDKEIIISKEFAEDWVKTRGSEDLVMKGHSTTYYYNGVKQGTKKQFDLLFNADFGLSGVKDYQGVDIIQLLINPLYLGRMGDNDDWKNLRALIIDLVGDVKDEDVFMTKPTLDKIKSDLDLNMGRTDQLVKRYNDDIKGLKEAIIGCDSNIALLSKTERPSDEEVNVAKRGIEECDANIRSLKVDDAQDKALQLIDSEIIELKKEIIDIKRKDLEKKGVNPLESKKSELQERKNDLLANFETLIKDRTSNIIKRSEVDNKINSLQKSIDECKAKRLNFLDELRAIDNQINNPSFETECPTCHRPYDKDKLEEIAKEYIGGLEKKKADLISKGKENSGTIVLLEASLKEAEDEKAKVENESARLESSVKLLNNERTSIDTELEKINLELEKGNQGETVNPAILEIEEKIKSKEDEKARIRASANEQEESVRSMIAAEQDKKESYQVVLDNYNYYSRVQEQLKEVLKCKDFSSKELASTEQKLELVKEFIKTKLQMLDSNVHKVFDDIEFRLIEPQVNGGYSTVCKPYIRGTRTLWKSGSKSEQVTTGVAICEKIKKALDLPNFMFVFDEGGEISTDTFTNRFDTESQLICVQVKDGIRMPTVMHI